MKRFNFFFLTILSLFTVFNLAASVYTPISLMFDITKSNVAFVALIALFFFEVIWLRMISASHILKVFIVVPIMNLASIVITTWGPYFIFENIITGKFTRYMVYVNFKDFMSSKTALMHGALLIVIWVLINVAVEAMVVGLFYHQINKRSLVILLTTMHLLSVGVALTPELMKKFEIQEVKIERSVAKPTEAKSEKLVEDKKPKEKEAE
jgi:hypothetical protein